MSNNTKMTKIQDTKNANEWINWIEASIAKEYIKYYEYKNFSNIQEIGSGRLGKVFRANYKESEQPLALKSFSNLNNAITKEIIREIKLQRDVNFHENIIHFYGITKLELEKNYLLVLEYANGDTLRNYLKKNFNKLTWKDKYNLSYQLTCALSCLHNKGIMHNDLRSDNILVHQNTIKLTDFGLTKRIEDACKLQPRPYGIIPYVDPKRFSKKNSNNPTQIYSLNKKSDVYSIGVLLWEISSGRPPFYTEGELYDVDLTMNISQGLRETPVPDTPEDYVKIYTECWDGEPDKRPTMNQVVDKLKAIITENSQVNNCKSASIQEEFNNQIIQNFDNVESTTEQTLSDKNLGVVNEIVAFILRVTNEGREQNLRKQHILNYFNDYNINQQKIYDWLINNQNDLNSVFLLGYFNYLGIVTRKNDKEAFNLFIKISKDHILAHYYVGECYQFGFGITKNEKLAFKYFEKVANKDYAMGQSKVGYYYDKGIDVKKNLKMASYWYEKAANNGNNVAMYNLAFMYIDKRDYKKAFELFRKSAEHEDSDGVSMLGYCYNHGIGTDVDKKKAFELYQQAANLGNSSAQYNLGNLYENGQKNISKAIYWYDKSAKQGDQDARIKMTNLKVENGRIYIMR